MISGRATLKLNKETVHPFREAGDHNNGLQKAGQAGIYPNQLMIDLNTGDTVMIIKGKKSKS